MSSHATKCLRGTFNPIAEEANPVIKVYGPLVGHDRFRSVMLVVGGSMYCESVSIFSGHVELCSLFMVEYNSFRLLLVWLIFSLDSTLFVCLFVICFLLMKYISRYVLEKWLRRRWYKQRDIRNQSINI
jgi:hypothetical protein